MSELTKVLITVKTYPTISRKYDELVCTAGLLEDGTWVRIYPLPFRKLDYESRYNKYQWLELPLEKNASDARPESFRVSDMDKIRLLDKIDTSDEWTERRNIILGKPEIHIDLSKLIERANNNELSLAVFKPDKIKKFVIENTEREWPKDKLEILREKAKQLSLFDTPEEIINEFKVVQKLPYKFSYTFTDIKGKESTLMIEDWEIGALYWSCLQLASGDEEIALEKVRQKYYDDFIKKDLYLFLGTTQKFHGWAKNPFVIIGVFYPPYQTQLKLF
jgi:hypothetical protein